jgi:hypothetical protein
VSAEQGVHFTMLVHTKKSEFETFLNRATVHVIYSGHARWGRGPCFGRGHGPSEEWEDGAAGKKADTGLFRMGYPFIALPTSEIVEHGYTANALEAVDKPASKDCHPDLRPHLYHLRAKTAAQIDPKVVPFVKNKDPNAKFWTYGAYDEGSRRAWLILRAGWTDTTTKPHEIGAHDPTCRVFCHFGCSTFKHNYRIVRKQKGWVREGNDRYAYWLTNLADGRETVYWLHHILTYKKFNAFESWEPSLKYAVQKTNRDLLRDGERYRVI